MACSINTKKQDVIQQEAQEQQNFILSEVVNTVSKILSLEFLSPISRKKDFFSQVKELQHKLEDIEDRIKFNNHKLKSKDTSAKERRDLNKNNKELKVKVKEIKKAIKTVNQRLKDEDEVFKTKEKIIKIMQDRMIMLVESKALALKSLDSYAEAMKYFIEKRFMSGSLDDADLGTLNGVYNTLDKIFKKQDKGYKFGKGWFSSIRATIYDPIYAMMAYDKTMKAVAFVDDTYEVLTRVSQKQNRFNIRLKNAFIFMQKALKRKGILYKVDALDPDKPTQSEFKKSQDNIVSLIHDILDGRVKFIKPTLINKKNFTKKDAVKVAKIVDYAIESGIEKDIHNIPGTDLYYVTIMEKDEVTGKEVWKAIMIPVKMNTNGRPSFTYPLTKNKKKISIKFLQEISNLNKELSLDNDGSLLHNNEIVLKEGWMEANENPKVYEGKNKFNQKIHVKGYQEYEAMDNLDETLSKEVYKAVSQLRSVFKDLFDDTKKSVQEAEEMISKATKTLISYYKNKGLSAEQIQEKVTEFMNSLDISFNAWVDDNGDFHTDNGSMEERDLYAPYQWDMVQHLKNLFEGQRVLEDKIKTAGIEYDLLTEKLKTAKDAKERAEISKRQIEINDDIGNNETPGWQNSLDAINEKLAVALGDKAYEDMEEMTLQQRISYAKHRSLFTNPANRRKDLEVFKDVTDRMVKIVEYNKLRANLFETLLVVDPALHSYLIDQLKAATGRTDTAAGIGILKYDDETILKMINNPVFKKLMGGEMTPEQFRAILSNLSLIISGNLLRTNTALMNNFQRLSNFIWRAEIDPFGAMEDLKNSENGQAIIDEIIREAGTTDVITAIADAFFTNDKSGGMSWYTGFFSKADLVIFKLSKRKFLQKTKVGTGLQWLNEWIRTNFRVRGREEIIAEKELDQIRGNIYDFIDLLSRGRMTEKQALKLAKKLERIIDKEIVLSIASWGMGGLGLLESEALQGLKPYLTMLGSEVKMRSESTLQGLAIAEQLGKIPDDVMKNPEDYGISHGWLWPPALKFARNFVSKTMFYFSLQHLPPAMRGAFGHFLTKYKPYSYKQALTEMELFLNFRNQQKGLSLKRQAEQIQALILGVGKGNLFGMSYRQTIMLRKFWQTRMMASILAVGALYVPFLTSISRLSNRKIVKMVGLPNLFGQMVRGGESVIFSSFLRLIMVAFYSIGLVGIGTDEDKKKEQKTRDYVQMVFMPLLFNVIIDAWDGDNKQFNIYKGLRVFDQGLATLGDWMGEIFGAEVLQKQD